VPTELQLLNTIFDDATSREEREKAIASLKKTTGKDRAGLVERYATATSKVGGGIDTALMVQVVRAIRPRWIASGTSAIASKPSFIASV